MEVGLGGEGGRGPGIVGWKAGKSKGRPRKPLAEVYSRERPVARHFVWGIDSIPPANRKSLKISRSDCFGRVGFAP
jgi:hypothetical protein